MQCVKTTLKMFLPDNILHICDQTRWHDCNHKKCGTAELFSLHMLPDPYIWAYMQRVKNTQKVFLHATRQDGTGNSENMSQHATRQDHKGRSHNTWAILPASYSRSDEPLWFCEFNYWKHKTFAHQDLRAKSAWFRDRVISCVTLNAFSTFPSSVFSTLPILCKAPLTLLALHSEVMQNMSSLVVCLCYLSYWFYQTQQQTLWSSAMVQRQVSSTMICCHFKQS